MTGQQDDSQPGAPGNNGAATMTRNSAEPNGKYVPEDKSRSSS
jgi:hypothetical protein